jgi:hypothetical protein
MDKTTWAWRAALTATLAAAIAGTAAAQGVTFDGALSYSARDELTDPNDPDNKFDNDIFRAMGAVTWSLGDGRMRAALEYGVQNNDFSGDYPWMAGVELAFGRRVGDRRYGIGARVRGAEDLSTTTELGYAMQHLGTRFDLRGLVGGQFIANADDVPGRDNEASLFGLGEATYYATPNLALSGAIQGDTDGWVYGAGVEYSAASWGGISLFLDYAEAFDEYRGQSTYDSLTGGIRIVPGAATLRAARQSNLGLLLRRYVEVQ